MGVRSLGPGPDPSEMALSVRWFTHRPRLSLHKIRQIPGARRGRMRVHHAIAIVAVVLIVFGLKLTFFSAQPAEAIPVEGMRIHISQMRQNIRNLPEQRMHDMTFVFSEGD